MSNTKNFGGSSNMRTQVQNLWQAINNLSSQIDPSNNPVDPSNNQIPPGSSYSDYIYWDNSTSSYKSGGDKVHIGSESGSVNQSSYATAVGYNSGNTNQAGNATAVGNGAGNQNQQNGATAVGAISGLQNQGIYATAVGYQSGFQNQGNGGVGVGQNSAYQSQGINAIAIGVTSGEQSQGDYAIALGFQAGKESQPPYSVCIGQSTNCTLDHEVVLGDSSCPQVKSHGYFVSDQGFKLSSGGSSTQYFTTDGGVGTPSSSGSSNIYLYNSSTNTDLLNINNGQIRYNQAVQPNANQICISHLTRNGIDIDPFLELVAINNIIYIQDQSTSVNYIKYKVIGPPSVSPNNFYLFTVSHLDSGGTGASNFPNGHDIFMSIYTDTATIDSRLNTLDSEVLALQNGKLSLTGGWMTGNIEMQNNSLERASLVSFYNTTNCGFANIDNFPMEQNVLLGSGNTNNDTDQILVGVGNSSSVGSNVTLAVGYVNVAESNYGICLGQNNTHGDTQQWQICIGSNNTTSGEGAMALGSNITNGTKNSLCIGSTNQEWIFPNSGSCALGHPGIHPFKEIYIDGGIIKTSGTSNDVYCADGSINSSVISEASSALSLAGSAIGLANTANNTANTALTNANTALTRTTGFTYSTTPIIKTSIAQTLDMGNNRITCLFTPSQPSDLTTKTYVDTALSAKLNLSGGTLTGNLDVNTYSVQNVNTLTVNQITPTSSTASDIGTSALSFRDFYIYGTIKQSAYSFLDFQNYDTNYAGMLFVQGGAGTIATRSTSNWTALGSSTSNAPVYNLLNVFNRQPCTALFTTVAVADGAPCGFVSTASTGISVNTGFSWGLQAFLGIADTAHNTNNCQNFFGLWNTNTGVGLTQAIQLSTRTNFIAFGSNTTDTNLCIYTAGASSTVKQVDLGVNFPANRPSGSASVDFFRLSMYYNQSTGVVYYKVANLNTGYNVVGSFTPVAGSMPLSSVALYPQINRTMGSPQTTGQAKLQVQRFGVLMF